MNPSVPSRCWWKESVVYQIYPRSFYDSDGDGLGDIQGIIQKLDYLHALGVDMLWLTPIYQSPDKDNGYDISDYQAIQPQFGTLPDAEQLIREAHRRGIRIMMDLVLNHSSDQHPWFIESRKSKDNPYRDFYIWRDPVDGKEPNNWAGHFSRSAWTFDGHTGQYYLHTFSPFQPDLNWQNPRLRAAMRKMILWWINKGVDGFRLDAISFISKASGFPNHRGVGDYIFDVQNMMHGPAYHDYLRELAREVFIPHRVVTVGECIDLSVESAVEVAGPEREELDMPFLFEHTSDFVTNGKDYGKLQAILSRWQTGLHNRAWIGLAFNNHDLPRVVSTFGDDRRCREASAKLFGTLLLSLEGTPFIYQGEEIGMTNVAFERIEDYNDLDTIHRYQQHLQSGRSAAEAMAFVHAFSRDNARTPVQWSAAPQAGFTSGTPWLKVNPNYTTINVEQCLSDPNSVFYHYQAMIRLRKQHLALVYGEYRQIDTGSEMLYAFTRSLEEEQILVLLNLGEETSYDTSGITGDLLISNYPPAPGEQASTLTLKPYEARIYRLR